METPQACMIYECTGHMREDRWGNLYACFVTYGRRHNKIGVMWNRRSRPHGANSTQQAQQNPLRLKSKLGNEWLRCSSLCSSWTESEGRVQFSIKIWVCSLPAPLYSMWSSCTWSIWEFGRKSNETWNPNEFELISFLLNWGYVPFLVMFYTIW